MRIGILLCDHVRDNLQPIFGDYPAFFIDLFARVAPQDEVRIYDVTLDHYPSTLGECEVYFISGSKKGCYDPLAWIGRLQEYICECHHASQPIVGICFGHQLMAQAFGGLVERSTKGWGIGVHTYLLDTQQDLFGGKNPVRVLVSHRDQVIKPGKDAHVLGGNDFCPNAVVSYGATTIGMQGHPELTEKYARAVVDIRRDDIGEQTCNQFLHGPQKAGDHELIATSLLHYHLR